MLTLLAPGMSGSGGASARGATSNDRDDFRFTVGLWGDVPYNAVQEGKIAPLTADMNKAGLAFSVFDGDISLAFSVFDGDIKSGGGRCSDDVFTTAIARFDAFESPMVYAPGDNEWTDCHRTAAGGFNNLERLAHLRPSSTRRTCCPT